MAPWKQSGPYAAVRVNGPVGPPGPWAPPSIPLGSVNPLRAVEVQAGQRGLTQYEADAGTKQGRGNEDYARALEQIGTREGREKQDYEHAGQQLRESFQRLAGRQGEQANSAGVLRGGAVLQAAQKRAANETKGREGQTLAYQRQQQADQEARGEATRGHERGLADLGTGLLNAQSNQTFFANSQGTLEDREAADQGVEPQVPPKVPRPWSYQNNGRTAVRVGGRYY